MTVACRASQLGSPSRASTWPNFGFGRDEMSFAVQGQVGAFREVLAQPVVRVSLRPRCRGLVGSSMTPSRSAPGLQTAPPAGADHHSRHDHIFALPKMLVPRRRTVLPTPPGSAPVALDLGERCDTLAGKPAAHQPTVMTIWPLARPLAMLARPCRRCAPQTVAGQRRCIQRG